MAPWGTPYLLYFNDLAERGGFEPPVQALVPYNRLAICPVQPLQHLSAMTYGRPSGPRRPLATAVWGTASAGYHGALGREGFGRVNELGVGGGGRGIRTPKGLRPGAFKAPALPLG